VPVPYAPRPPLVELVPERPEGLTGLVWADGGWEWRGDRFRWAPGGWVVPAPGARRVRWVIVRRTVDGQLFFAPSSWQDDAGHPLAAPPPVARATTRAGVPAPAPARSDLDE
jgi:hypothetical protein